MVDKEEEAGEQINMLFKYSVLHGGVAYVC